MSDAVPPLLTRHASRWQPPMGRALALLVGTLMLFSVLVMGYYGMWVDWNTEKRLAYSRADRVARTGAELQFSLIESTKVLLDTMASTPVVRWGTSSQLRDLFKGILPKHDQRYLWWMIINGDGSSLVRVGHGVIGLLDDSWQYSTEVTIDARVQRRFSVGEYMQVGSQHLLPMAIPVFDENGRILRFLLAAWDVSMGMNHLPTLLDEGDQLRFITPNERMVLQFPPENSMANAEITAPLRDALSGPAQSARFEDTDTSGGVRYVVLQPMLDDSGKLLAYAVGSVERPTFFRFVVNRYAGQLISFTIMIFAAMGLTWAFCRRYITGGLEHLTNVARRTSMGDLSVRNNRVPSCLEVQTVAYAYDRMLDSLASNARELADREQRLSLALDAAQQGVWTWRPDVPCLECDARLARMIGLTGAACLDPTDLYERMHPEDKERLLHSGDLFTTNESEFRKEFRVRNNSEGWNWILFIGRLSHGSGNFFGIAMDVTRRKEADAIIRADTERYKILSNTDPLTGLWNRRYFTQMVSAEVRRARRYKRPFTMGLCDLDFFKRVNDTYGHDAGDAVLIHFSRLLQANLRDSDVMARVGGEEFAFFFPETDIHSARIVFDKIRTLTAETPINYGDKLIYITVSCGLAPHEISGCDTNTYEQLMSLADAALYNAKHLGRNRIEVAHASNGLQEFLPLQGILPLPPTI